MLAALSTLEMRWFLTGPIPHKVQTWFQDQCPGDRVGQHSERMDHYLFLPNCDSVGIKLRAERFEVKWRTQVVGQWVSKGQAGGRSHPPPPQGQLECWQKLNYKNLLDAQGIFQAAQLPGQVWLSVQKQRQLRCHHGVQIELVQLLINQKIWWSLSLEAPQLPSIGRCLEAVIQQLSQSYPGPALTADKSYAFPTWLSRLGSQG